MTTPNTVRLARNAALGDGYFWKHPESRRYKAVFVGTNRYWLDYKARLCNRTMKLIRAADSSNTGVYTNAKPLWGFTTLAADTYTRYAVRDALDIVAELDLRDMAAWYLDDGCTIERRDYVRADARLRYRYLLCVGTLCPTEACARKFLELMSRLFVNYIDTTIGRVVKNNSKASKFNKTWTMPVPVGKAIVSAARELGSFGFDQKLRCR